MSPRGAAQPPVELVAAIFDAASSEDLWHGAVSQMTEWLGGIAGGLQVRVFWPELAMNIITCGVDEGFGRAYDEHYFRDDPTWPHADRLLQGQTLVSREILPDDQLVRTEFFQDWARPQGFGDLLGGIILKDATRVVTYATFGPRRSRFDGDSRGRLDALLPHLTRAMKVSLELRALRTASGSFELAASTLRFASLRVDRRLNVLCLGPGCEAMFDGERAPLRRRGRRVEPGEGLSHEVLLEAVEGALAGASSTIRLRHDGRSAKIVVAPSPEAPARAAELLVWSGPCRAASIHQLPPSLQRVAELLVEGLSDKEIASRMKMPIATARTYVARVLQRVGVRSRRELMRRGDA